MPRSIIITTFGEKGYGKVVLTPGNAADADAMSAALASQAIDALLHKPTDDGGRPADLTPAHLAATLSSPEGRAWTARIRDAGLRASLEALRLACSEPRLTATAKFEYLPGTDPTRLYRAA